ncbi:uncharacterized protein LOC124449135 [Xenia sp. Carnegie-2017]|uniref:uncharacterized protein LOC124449135 n=1 Tax=Xenia sp. Carnegie-2017 TaxID=2897299 RepID=UPI001F038D72|nr:uncharacterized protein LOC124449135 [Xenia sp. Carnegie-2017]
MKSSDHPETVTNLEMLAIFDPFLAQHIKCTVNKGRGHTSYLSKTICDEMVHLLANRVREHLDTEVKSAKYFSVSVDSTLDISHFDKLSWILRYALLSGHVERFVAFLEMQGHTGSELAESLLEFLKAHDIAIADCRAPPHRWIVLMNQLSSEGLPTVKRMSDTRWSARVDATKALVKGYDEINDALVEITDDEEEKPETREEARGLAAKKNQLETRILAVLWHHILHRFHANSQALHSANQDLNSTVAIYEFLMDFISKQRARFEEFEAQGKKLSQCDHYVGDEKRVRQRNRRCDESGSAPEVLQSSANKFLAEVNENAKILLEGYPVDLEAGLSDEVLQFSGFLIIHFAVKSLDVTNVSGTCLAAMNETSSDESDGEDDTAKDSNDVTIDADSLELCMYRLLLKNNQETAFPNTVIALWIYLSLMISYCSGERSFSKLKLIKNQLRSCMTEEQLNSLVLLSIENYLLRGIDISSIINEFAVMKSRK